MLDALEGQNLKSWLDAGIGEREVRPWLAAANSMFLMCSVILVWLKARHGRVGRAQNFIADWGGFM